MGFKDIKDYISKQLIFPKVLIVDEPGVITNKTVGQLSKKNVRTRIIFTFEDIYSNLYFDTLNKLGKKEADLLTYKIGKDNGFRYCLLSKAEKIKDAFIPDFIYHIFNTFRGVGMSFSENIMFDLKKKSIIFKGTKNIICRKSHSGFMMAGIVSGILSFLFGRNIEARVCCDNCPNGCNIIADYGIEKVYVPDVKELVPRLDYEDVNFRKMKLVPNTSSLTDFFKFKRLQFDKFGKFSFEGETVMPCEVGLLDLHAENYLKIGELDLFRDSVVKTSREIAKKLLIQTTNKDKIKQFENILSGFGYGIPYFKKIGDEIIAELSYAPITKYRPFFRVFLINGFLNEIFGKEFYVKELTESRIIYSIRLH